MNQAEFNQMLQTVQEIELAKGFTILRLVINRKEDGRIHECVWVDARNQRVLWQSNPFTDQARYNVDDARYSRIVYTDFWK